MHQPAEVAMQLEHLVHGRYPTVITKSAWITKTKLLQFLPCVIAHVSVSFQQMIKHVVVEANQHAIFGDPNINFVAIATELECGTIRLERIFVGKFRCAAMADD